MAGYRLYGWHQTGSMAIKAALAEAGGRRLADGQLTSHWPPDPDGE